MTGVRFPRQLPPSGAEGPAIPGLEQLGVLHTGPEERFDRIAVLARLVLGVAGAGIVMQDRNRPFIKAAVGLAPTSSPECAELARQAMSPAGAGVVDNPPGAVAVLAQRRTIRFYAGRPVNSPDGDRVGTLFVVDDQSRPFSERDERVLNELEWWVERELQRSAELDQAADVQRKLMPETLPKVPGYEFAASCVPCRGVGGDFFDWYPTDRGLCMTLGDVMGKGIGAAMLMAVACSMLRAAGRQFPPAEAVKFADLALQEELESTATLITLCHGDLEPATGVVRYVDAGHGMMFSILRDGTIRRAPAELGSLPLGVLPGEPRSEVAMRLEPGDVAFIFSDGLLDLYDGSTDAVDVIAQEARAVADRGAQAIVDHFAEMAMHTTLSDDVTVTAYRRCPS